MLIVLTGIDGSGKTSAAKALASSSLADGKNALLLSNYAGRRRMSLLAARFGVQLPPRLADAVETTIRVANVLISHVRARRFRGLTVMDRHLHCQLALREARGLPRGRLLPWLLRKLPTPDLVIHLDIDPQQAHDRIVARGTDEESLADLTSLRDAYRSLPEFADFTIVNAGAPEHEVLAGLKRVIAAAEEARLSSAKLKV
ncbi:AAA family ATPase [Arthrobacter sp. ZGTC131]|uniref:AAA family ATPase n=1 Tax=Arthrobacter sp. ZGTC131 TaxID=2058898 RepID=UPI000CE51F05|nr:AAA family ATPase [Arthrobacter sp. ZGTC131]